MSNAAEALEGFLDKKVFSRMVERFVLDHHDVSYMDAIVHLCEKHNVEIEDSKKLLTPSLVGHLEAEARSLNFLPRVYTLDV